MATNNSHIRICILMIIYFKTYITAQLMTSGQTFPFPFPPHGPSPWQGIPIPPLPPSGSLMPPPPYAGAMPFAMSQSKLPTVIMPYYSKNEKRSSKYKKRRRSPKKYKHLHISSESDASDSTSLSDFQFRATHTRHPKKRRREPLTPVISYVTKDGYVVYQKKIQKDRAKDWLNLGKKVRLPD